MIYKVNIVKKSKKNSSIKPLTIPIYTQDQKIKASKELMKNLVVFKSKNHYRNKSIKIKISTTIIIKNTTKNKHYKHSNTNIITTKLPSPNLITIELKHKAKNISNPTIIANFNKINDHKKDRTTIFIIIMV
jgi:hypothetical protein